MDSEFAFDNETRVDYWSDAGHHHYHLKQFENKFRYIDFFEDFIARCLGDDIASPKTALDVACGGGALIYYLSQKFPHLSWTGSDLHESIFTLGKAYFDKKNIDVSFQPGDFFCLKENLKGQKFDIITFTQTLMILREYERCISQMIQSANDWVFVVSLFTDSLVDTVVRLEDHSQNLGKDMVHYYSIFSIDRFKDFCIEQGAVDVVHEDFNIDIDIPKLDNQGMGTYTRKMEN